MDHQPITPGPCGSDWVSAALVSFSCLWIRSDKELGIHDAKIEAREQIRPQRKAAQREFIAAVGESMGWRPEDLVLDASELSPGAAKRALAQHESILLVRARREVEPQRS